MSFLGRHGPAALAAALALATYTATLGHGFAYDDAILFRSPLLGRLADLRELFSNGFYASSERYFGLYRPLGDGSLLLDASLARGLLGAFDRPLLFHATNVLLHAAASALLAAWLLRIGIARWTAAAAACLWAVHPIHAEVAANVTARYESLAAVLGFAYLIARRDRRAVLAPALLLLALWSKESAVALPLVAALAQALLAGEGRRFSLRASLVDAGVVALWLVLRAFALEGERGILPFLENPVVGAPIVARVATALAVQLVYLRDQALPLWLSTDHSYAQTTLVRSLADPRVLGFVAVLAAAAALAWRVRRIRPEVALAVLAYACLFSTTSNLLFPIGTIQADRLAYVPSAFTCLLAALALERLRRHAPRLALGVAAAAVLALGGLAIAQAADWKDDLTLFRAQVRTAPRSVKAHTNLGAALHKAGRLPEAEAEFEAAIRIYPFHPEAYQGLAWTYELAGSDPEKAIEAWGDSIRYAVTGGEPRIRRVLALADLGRWGEIRELRDVIAAEDPGDRFLVRIDALLTSAQRLARMPASPEDVERGLDLARRGDHAGAQSTLLRALHQGIVPEARRAEVLVALARAFEALGKPGRAAHFRDQTEKRTE